MTFVVTDIPSWAMQMADDFHGAQEVDLALARWIAQTFTPSVANLPRATRNEMIELAMMRTEGV